MSDVSFDVADGEFLTLLGPSGCGKSTTLAALAGLDRPTGGTHRHRHARVFDGASGIFVDAQFRNFGLMFQSYALWPHMTVTRMSAFPLRCAASAAPRRGSGSPMRSRWSRWTAYARPLPGRTLRRPAAARGAGARRSSTAATSCCSTSRSPTSTPSCGIAPASGCASCSAAPASRPSTSRTTRPRRWR